MRTRTSSDSIVSEPSRYDLILVALPVPLCFGLVVGTFTDLPVAQVVGLCGLVSVSVLAYGLFVAVPRPPTDSNLGTALDAFDASIDASFEAVDASLDAVDDAPRDDTGEYRRRRGV